MNKRLPIFVGIGVLVLAVLVFMFVYSPKKQAVGKVKADLATAQAKQSELEVRLAQLQAIKQGAQETKSQLDKISTEIPPTADIPGLIRLLRLAADKVPVGLTVQTNGTPSVSGTGTYSTIGVQLTVDGNFYQIENFLSELETLPRLMKVTSVNVSASTWPVLALQVSAEVYTSDISAGPGSTPGHQGGAEVP
jgi:Tfp pilus assembly protein PilO